MIKLLPHQEEAIKNLRTGSILWGGVGSGKSVTSLKYFYNERHLKNHISNLYIITTARKRDSQDWFNEARFLGIPSNITITVDSWNNIKKYKEVVNSFFIFDEQRLVGSGAWVRSFYKIVKRNNWILLTATPGDNCC